MVVELYPRLLTGPVAKRNPVARIGYLEAMSRARAATPRQTGLLQAAAASEDAFDAAVSALGMYTYRDALAAPGVPLEVPPYALLEGLIWEPQR